MLFDLGKHAFLWDNLLVASLVCVFLQNLIMTRPGKDIFTHMVVAVFIHPIEWFLFLFLY